MNEMTPNGNQNQGNAYPEQSELRSDSSRYNSGIDWKSLFYYLLGRIYWILIAAVLCGGLAGGYTKLFVKPVYEATADERIPVHGTAAEAAEDIESRWNT